VSEIMKTPQYMITFFRKIRQELIAESRLSKYLIYALGEIVLVVIGILIALQINNWNENRKLKKQAEAYVGKIISDLKKDTVNINELWAITSKFQKDIFGYREYFKSADSLDLSIEHLLDSSRRLDIRYIKYYPVNKTFKDMEYSGNSDLLSDDQRDILIKLVAFQEEFEKANDSYLNVAIEELQYSARLTGKSDDFYNNLNLKNSEERNAQGLLHRHLHIGALDDMYSFFRYKGEQIKSLSHEASELFHKPGDNLSSRN